MTIIPRSDAFIATKETSEIVPADCNDSTDVRLKDSGIMLNGELLP